MPEENTFDRSRDSLPGVLGLTQSGSNDFSTDERESSLYEDVPEGKELTPSTWDDAGTVFNGDLGERTRVAPVSESDSIVVLCFQL